MISSKPLIYLRALRLITYGDNKKLSTAIVFFITVSNIHVRFQYENKTFQANTIAKAITNKIDKIKNLVNPRNFSTKYSMLPL